MVQEGTDIPALTRRGRFKLSRRARDLLGAPRAGDVVQVNQVGFHRDLLGSKNGRRMVYPLPQSTEPTSATQDFRAVITQTALPNRTPQASRAIGARPSASRVHPLGRLR